MVRALRLRFALLSLLLVLLLPAGNARADTWTQWVDTINCAVGRTQWLAVAKESPGFGWEPAPGNQYNATFAEAVAFMDSLRISSGAFRRFCCLTSTYVSSADPTARRFTFGRIVSQPADPPTDPGLMPEIAMAPCCEDAAFQVGSDPFGCTAVPLMSVPGAIVLITPSGPVSAAAGPITIPTSPPTVVASAAAPQRQAGASLGCYRDPNNPFNLDGYLERSGQNTPQRCVQICKDRGFAYAGVEYSESCLCGNSYDQFGPADNCDMTCTGDPGQICGGINATSVYATGL